MQQVTFFANTFSSAILSQDFPLRRNSFSKPIDLVLESRAQALHTPHPWLPPLDQDLYSWQSLCRGSYLFGAETINLSLFKV